MKTHLCGIGLFLLSAVEFTHRSFDFISLSDKKFSVFLKLSLNQRVLYKTELSLIVSRT